MHRILDAKGHDVATIAPDASLADAAGELARHGIGALVVTDAEGAIVGIVSERDLVRSIADHGTDALTRRVRDAMTASVHTCAPDATVDQLMAQMTDHRIRHVPVVDGTAMVGIVSIGDVVKRRVQQLVTETEHLTEYIAGTTR